MKATDRQPLSACPTANNNQPRPPFFIPFLFSDWGLGRRRDAGARDKKDARHSPYLFQFRRHKSFPSLLARACFLTFVVFHSSHAADSLLRHSAERGETGREEGEEPSPGGEGRIRMEG